MTTRTDLLTARMGASRSPCPSSHQLSQITPVFVEKQTGDDVAPELEKQHGGVTKESRLNRYVSFIGRKMVPFSKRPKFQHKFQVLETTKIINAFALGNGNIYVTKGLMKLLRDEAELAVILGHEIGHVSRRHIGERIDLIVGGQLLLLAAEAIFKKKATKETDLIGKIVFSLVVNGFGRSNELESDKDGLRFAFRAEYDPNAAVRVFRAFQLLEKKVSGLEAFFRSHPTAKERIGVLEARIAKNFRGATGNTFRARYQDVVFKEGDFPRALKEEVPVVPIAVSATAAVLSVLIPAVLLL